MSEKWKAILTRAWHTVWQTAAATMPATLTITPAMIKDMDISVLYIFLAWIATALLAGFMSIIKSIAVGVPEAEDDDIDYSQEIQSTYNAESIGDMMEGNYDEAENYGTELE